MELDGARTSESPTAVPTVRGKLQRHRTARQHVRSGPLLVSILETVERARAILERNGRVSLCALPREFELDGEMPDELE